MTPDEFDALTDMARLRGLHVWMDSRLLIVSNENIVGQDMHEKRLVARTSDLQWAISHLAHPFFGERK